MENRYIIMAMAKNGMVARRLGNDVSILASCVQEKMNKRLSEKKKYLQEIQYRLYCYR